MNEQDIIVITDDESEDGSDNIIVSISSDDDSDSLSFVFIEFEQENQVENRQENEESQLVNETPTVSPVHVATWLCNWLEISNNGRNRNFLVDTHHIWNNTNAKSLVWTRGINELGIPGRSRIKFTKKKKSVLDTSINPNI